MGLRDRISAAKDLPREEVYVEEWDLKVHVRRVPAEHRDEFERLSAAVVEGTLGSSTYMADFAALVLCDENGEPVFDHTNEEDMKILRGKAPHALRRLMAPGMAVNGIAVKEVEDQAEKSEGDPDSGSDSD